MRPAPKKRRRPGYELRILTTTIFTVLPSFTAVLVLLFLGDFSTSARWTAGVLVAVATVFALYVLHSQLVYPLRTLSNLIASIREEDYSFRAREAGDDAMGEVMREVNDLISMFRERRLDALEATALVRAVIAEIDSAILAFDGDHRLLLINRAGEQLLGRPAEVLHGRTAEELGLEDCLVSDDLVTIQRVFPGGNGRWGIRRSTFREKGLQHQLLVISDLSRALRQEERQAWQRLLRVLGHELNNSLAPIRSITTSLTTVLAKDSIPPDSLEDLRSGVAVISSRSEALTRFMDAYSRLARLPRPTTANIDVAALIRRVAKLEQRKAIRLEEGPEIMIRADADQIEQALINLIRNGVDAVAETGGDVSVAWYRKGGRAVIIVRDEGLGISGKSNLFVPFYTTKPGGTGIGLALSRQIVEAHGGALTLHDRHDRTGCEARLTLPA